MLHPSLSVVLSTTTFARALLTCQTRPPAQHQSSRFLLSHLHVQQQHHLLTRQLRLYSHHQHSRPSLWRPRIPPSFHSVSTSQLMVGGRALNTCTHRGNMLVSRSRHSTGHRHQLPSPHIPVLSLPLHSNALWTLKRVEDLLG